MISISGVVVKINYKPHWWKCLHLNIVIKISMFNDVEPIVMILLRVNFG